ncbi:MAG: glycosyltransferase family 39 protein [Thermomicrobiales bacterium]
MSRASSGAACIVEFPTLERDRSGRVGGWIKAHVHVVTSLGLFLGFLIVRLPFRTSYPVNWDAVQFLLGIQNFDVRHHQPHPPGYIGYIGLGKLLNVFIHDPHLTLTMISVVAGGLVPAMFYPFARRFMTARLALVSSVVFGASTLIWYYSEVALTYVVELAILLPFLLLIHRAIYRPGGRDLVLASCALAMVGSFRQTALVLMLPLWLYAAWQHGWPERIKAGAALASGVLVWLVPLLWLSGGPVNYFNLSRELAEITGGNTSILSLNPAGPAKNAGFVLAGLAIGVNLVAMVLLLGSPALMHRISASSTHDRAFFALWSLPSLAVYLLGHTGQIGYILILLPIPFIGLGIALPYVSSLVHRMRPQVPARVAGIGLVLVLLVTNVAGVFALPAVINRTKPHSIPLDVRQFDLEASDAHWREVTATIRNYPPDSTVVLTTIGGPRVSGSFRHLGYLMPDYHIYGLGRGLENGVFGSLFHTYERHSNYEIGAMEQVQERIDLPLDARYIVIPDAEIAERMELALDEETAWTDSRGDLTVIVVEPGSSVVFSISGDVITFSQCSADACGPAPSRAG